mgnify:CR=1 FL=1
MAYGYHKALLSGLVLAGGLMGVVWGGFQAAVAADPRYRGKPTTPSAVQSGKRPATPTVAAPETPPLPMPKETVLGEDPRANINSLKREKLEILRQREDLLRRALAAGQATQNQVDDATMDALRMELELQDRAHLRIIALEKIVEIRKRFEEDAETELNTKQPKGNDARNVVSAHGRYVQARLRRINAQMDLEQERAAQTPANR